MHSGIVHLWLYRGPPLLTRCHPEPIHQDGRRISAYNPPPHSIRFQVKEPTHVCYMANPPLRIRPTRAILVC